MYSLYFSGDRGFVCEAKGTTIGLIISAAVCLLFYQFAPVLHTQNIVMQKERKVVRLCDFINHIMLEVHR